MDKTKILSDKEFDLLSEFEKSNYVKSYYNSKDGSSKYATSPDFNLRELEIDFILKNIEGENILDLGCGNGYTLMRIAQEHKGNVIGVDFSNSMIDGANKLLNEYPGVLKSKPDFHCADATNFIPKTGFNSINTVISERFLLNLPTEEMQYNAIKHIHKLLIPKGKYLMIEGSKDGLLKLNNLRENIGLSQIIDRDKHNLSSRKFEDKQIEPFISDLFKICSVKTFDLYYIISRIVYPDFIKPETAVYSHFINETARKLEQLIDFPSQGIGHVKCYCLEKI